jgi:mono/diheme cytochrome c family protein
MRHDWSRDLRKTVKSNVRSRVFYRVALIALLGVTFLVESCGKPPGADVSESASTYSSINAIIQTSCLQCHSGSGPGPGNFSSYSSLLASGFVIPSDPQGSELYIQVANGDMPQGGPPLSSSDVQAIYNWILAGAMNSQTNPSPLPSASPSPSSSPSPLPPPSLASISPNSGPATGSTSVTLTGTGFQSGATATIGGVTCGSLSVSSSTQISCVTGAHAVGTVSVVVTNPDSQSAALTNDYTYNSSSPPSPTITSVSPSTGSTLGGTNLTITGTNFAAGATVDVGGLSCSSPAVSGSTIMCTTPGHSGSTTSTVSVTVTVGGQTATSANSFAYTSTYSVVSSIISASCLSCHSGSGPGTGNFSSYSSLTATGFLSSGNASGSTLYMETSTNAMPEGCTPGVNCLTATQNQEIADWINSGIPNN